MTENFYLVENFIGLYFFGNLYQNFPNLILVLRYPVFMCPALEFGRNCFGAYSSARAPRWFSLCGTGSGEQVRYAVKLEYKSKC